MDQGFKSVDAGGNQPNTTTAPTQNNIVAESLSENSRNCGSCLSSDDEHSTLRSVKVETAPQKKAAKSDKLPKKVPRKWQYFPGKNKFYCDGRIITAPTIRFCVLCFALIVVTFSLFIAFDGPFLARNLSIAIPITGSILFIVVLVNMVKTSFSDPGILPRASQQEAEYIDKLYATDNQNRPPPRTKDIIVNGQVMKSKYCFTCKMFRPPRASHCGVCNNCVDRFDHHCPFLGNCIGKRNYRSFYAFIISLSLLCVFVLSCSIAHLAIVSKENGNFLEALRESPTSAVVIIISFFGTWTVLGLAGFHTYLIAVEQTTNEDIKGLFGKSSVKNPYSRGNMCQNCCFVLCGPLQPSLLDRRGFVTDDFLYSLPAKTPSTSNGLPVASYNPANFQISIKTGPHCAEPETRPTNNLVGSESIPLQNVKESTSATNPQYSQKDAGDGSISAGSMTGIGSASMSRSIGEVNSESMRNLYSSIEEIPSPELVEVRSHGNANNYDLSYYVSKSFGSNKLLKDEFDDPSTFSVETRVLKHSSDSDFDDPLNVTPRFSEPNTSSSSQKLAFGNSTKLKGQSYDRPLGHHSVSINNNSKNNAKKHKTKAVSSKFKSDSTMMNSPLHLDAVT